LSPDTRRPRGAHPADAELFHHEQLPKLRIAVSELSWLLSHGYNITSALKLVGDRHGLRERQRLAVARSSCSYQDQQRRLARCVSLSEIAKQPVIVDGFNLIVTIEAALSGGPLFRGLDKCIRDLSSVHGSYRSVEETERAIYLIGAALQDLATSSALWLLDRPVSNSGRLATRITAIAHERGWAWTVETVFNPDKTIVSSDAVAITSDASILNHVDRWVDLKTYLLETEIPNAWTIDLST
jgi:hypothetical protein